MCSFRKYPYPPQRVTEIPWGGGVQKEAISEGVGPKGVAYRGFSPGGLSKISELLIKTASLLVLSKLSVI